MDGLAYAPVEQTHDTIRHVSVVASDNRYQVILDYMRDKGWHLRDQLGSVLIFEKEDKRIGVSTRQFSKHYLLWDLPVNHE